METQTRFRYLLECYECLLSKCKYSIAQIPLMMILFIFLLSNVLDRFTFESKIKEIFSMVDDAYFCFQAKLIIAIVDFRDFVFNNYNKKVDQ